MSNTDDLRRLRIILKKTLTQPDADKRGDGLAAVILDIAGRDERHRRGDACTLEAAKLVALLPEPHEIPMAAQLGMPKMRQRLWDTLLYGQQRGKQFDDSRAARLLRSLQAHLSRPGKCQHVMLGQLMQIVVTQSDSDTLRTLLRTGEK